MRTMKTPTTFTISVLMILLSASAALAQSDGTTSEVQIMVGKSVSVNSPDNLKRVAVSDPAVATAMIVSPKEVLVHGQAPGTVTLILWDDQEHSRSYDIHVNADVTSLRTTMLSVFPSEKIGVGQSGATVILTGDVSSKSVMDGAMALAQTQSKSVVNMLQTTDTRQVVSLQVRFAEVDRNAITQWGANLFSTGATNTIGSVSTQQFGSLAAN